VLQEAVKGMRHSKRSTLTTDGVNSTLSLRNVEVILCNNCKARSFVFVRFWSRKSNPRR
jgi:hypothetical protein